MYAFDHNLECNGAMQPTTIANNKFSYGHYGFVLGADLGNIGEQGYFNFVGGRLNALEYENQWLGFDNTTYGAGYTHTFNNGSQNPATSIFITDNQYYTYCPGKLVQPFARPANVGITFFDNEASSLFTKTNDVLCVTETVDGGDSLYTADIAPLALSAIDTDWVLRAITDNTVFDLDTSGTISDYEKDYSARKHFFEKQQLYSIAKYDSGFTYSDTALLYNFMDTIASHSAIGKIDAAGTYLAQALKDSVFEDMVTDLDNADFNITYISGSLAAIQNSKLFLGIYSSIIIDTSALDSASHATLVDIATQCPWVGGKAVYQARVLLQDYDTTAYTSACEIADTSGMRMEQPAVSKKPVIQSALNIYPNPASDVININYKGATDNTWFVLYDMLGKEVGRIQLDKVNGKTTYNSGNLAEGLYFWNVAGLSDNNIRDGKIVIVRQ